MAKPPAKTTKSVKKSSKKQLPKKARKKVPTWTELNKLYQMLDTLSCFLTDSAFHRKDPKYSKRLVKQITEKWAAAAAKDKKQKHKAALIKSFGEYVSSV